jgi:hypothetical protein
MAVRSSETRRIHSLLGQRSVSDVVMAAAREFDSPHLHCSPSPFTPLRGESKERYTA